MALRLGLRHLARGASAPRIVASLHFRCFAVGSNAGGQRPAVPPAAPKPPPGPPAKPTPGAGVSRAAPATPAKPPVPAPVSAGAAKPKVPAAVSAEAAKPKVPSGRDPERPKRPATAWLRYLAQFRKENAALKGTEVMRTAAGKWKVLTAVQRKPYETPYEAEKKVYEKAFAEYVSSGKKDAWVRDPEKPKRPMTGFIRFAGEYRAKNTALKMTEASKKAGVLWKSMTTGAKASYDKRYATEKEAYEKLLKAYKDSGKEEAFKAKKGLTAAEKQKAKELAQKAKEADKQMKMKEREAAKKLKIKEKEAAKKLKMKEADTKRKEREAAKKLKMKESAAAKKEKDAAAKHAKVQQATKVAGRSRAAM